MSPSISLPSETIEQKIYLIRGHKVMLDSDLAHLYQVETRVLIQSLKRNLDRFPDDFMFQLNAEEGHSLTSQNVTSKSGRGGRRLPYAFTEQGVAMLSTILGSKQAIQVNIAIMRTFVKIRALLSSHADLISRLDEMEKKYDERFRVVFEAIRGLMAPEPVPPRQRIGFDTRDQD